MGTADPIGEQAWSIAENIILFDKHGGTEEPYRITVQVARSSDSSHRTAPCELLRVPQKKEIGFVVVPIGESKHAGRAPEDEPIESRSSPAPGTASAASSETGRETESSDVSTSD